MFLFNRKALAAIGAAAAAVATTTLFASPAQAATAGKAEVLGKHHSIIKFTAATGQQNSLVITISGRTITLDDKVAIKAGKGCKAIKGDATKVKCTTARKPTELSITLGDKNDKVYNKTAAPMVAEGGSGDDTLVGGSNRDRLFGGPGNDRLFGRADVDAIDGEAGDDYILAGSGNDWVNGGLGNDLIMAQNGNDTVFGGAGNDWISGGPGDDRLSGGPGKDKIIGGPGKDKITQ